MLSAGPDSLVINERLQCK